MIYVKPNCGDWWIDLTFFKRFNIVLGATGWQSIVNLLTKCSSYFTFNFIFCTLDNIDSESITLSFGLLGFWIKMAFLKEIE